MSTSKMYGLKARDEITLEELIATLILLGEDRNFRADIQEDLNFALKLVEGPLPWIGTLLEDENFLYKLRQALYSSGLQVVNDGTDEYLTIKGKDYRFHARHIFAHVLPSLEPEEIDRLVLTAQTVIRKCALGPKVA